MFLYNHIQYYFYYFIIPFFLLQHLLNFLSACDHLGVSVLITCLHQRVSF